jgi:hypothetical protein
MHPWSVLDGVPATSRARNPESPPPPPRYRLYGGPPFPIWVSPSTALLTIFVIHLGPEWSKLCYCGPMSDELFTVRVPVNVSPSMAAWLESRARAEDRSVAAVVRRLIAEAAGRVWASPGEGDVSVELAGVVRESRVEHPSVAKPAVKGREVRTFLKGVK